MGNGLAQSRRGPAIQRLYCQWGWSLKGGVSGAACRCFICFYHVVTICLGYGDGDGWFFGESWDGHLDFFTHPAAVSTMPATSNLRDPSAQSVKTPKTVLNFQELVSNLTDSSELQEE